jgi:phage terminase large subunit
MKSWSIARALLILGTQSVERILCAREFQNSLAESSHKLLSDQIHALGLNGWYEVTKSSICGKNGTEFIFGGLHTNLESIKSIEGLTGVWLEEAETISEESYRVLLPTIFRRRNAAVYISFNPKEAKSAT